MSGIFPWPRMAGVISFVGEWLSGYDGCVEMWHGLELDGR